MPPKKAKKERKQDDGKNFYDTQITDLNHILSYLRTKQIEVGGRNEELLNEEITLIQDEKDIISYLNRTIQDLTDEINGIQNECDRVEEERIKEAQDFENEKEKIQENHERIEENLLSDLKLTVGKLHALEEFRLLRDEIMQKYEILENEEEEQKVRHKREIYEVERKFIIGEDKLKKEMDAKLKWLIEKFQAVTDIRVAATTLRVLKENIALNNMIEAKFKTLRKLYDVHDKLESHDWRLQLMSHMSMLEANTMSNQSSGLKHALINLVNDYYAMTTTIKQAKLKEPTIAVYRERIKVFKDQIAEDTTRKLILEQNIHELRCQREDIFAKIRHEKARNDELHTMLREVAKMLQAPAVNDEVFSIYDQPPEGEEDAAHSKSSILFKICEFLMQVREWNQNLKPMQMLESRSDIYMQGRMGLVPREVILKSMIPTMEEKAEQVDGSFDLLFSEKSFDEEVCFEEASEMEVEPISNEESVVIVVEEQETQTDLHVSSSSLN